MSAATGRPHLNRLLPLIVVSSFILLLAIAACSSDEKTVEERAQALDRQLICPVCPGETIDQSQVQVAKDMRRIVRERLTEGEDEGVIKDYFVGVYGVEVLASPPASGFNLIVWIVPPVVLAFALGVLYWTLREMRRRRSMAFGAPLEASEAELATYLDAVDSEMRRASVRDRTDALSSRGADGDDTDDEVEK